MRGRSHQKLGSYLVQQHLAAIPRRCRRAFLFGCTEPDRNPATYLKGSVRAQWLRGHNWGNSQRYMDRVARRLERKKNLHIWDYYAMGKLIHYTVDAFTSAHNDFFPKDLQAHRHYEHMLQEYFLDYIDRCRVLRQGAAGHVMEAIRFYHCQYARNPISIRNDSQYSVYVSNLIIAMLMAKPISSLAVPGL